MTERFRIDDTVRDDGMDVVDGTEELGFFETGGVPDLVEDADRNHLVDALPTGDLIASDTATLMSEGVIGQADLKDLSKLDY